MACRVPFLLPNTEKEREMRQRTQKDQALRSRGTVSAPRLAIALLLAAAGALAQDRTVASDQGPTAQIPEPTRQVIVTIPDRKLALIEDGRLVKVYPVAVGRASSASPTGRFRIRERLTNPTYYAPGTVIPPGPANPLGPRWIGLSSKGYGIHGTNEPRSIGQAASHGCVRMHNRDVTDLFERVRAGDFVELHGERDHEISKWFAEGEASIALAQADARESSAATAPAAVASR
jgi:murein L,D-transpeptidase YcbB/YkuD